MWSSGFPAQQELEFGLDWFTACLLQSARDRFGWVTGAEVSAQQRAKLRTEERVHQLALRGGRTKAF
jgi:hypothetical protein